MKDHKKMVKEWMQDAEFKTKYDAVEEEFAYCLKLSCSPEKARSLPKRKCPSAWEPKSRQWYAWNCP